MTDLERRALLGDKQAQEECTEKGIVLPCPFCGGKSSARYTGNNSGFKGFKSNIYMRSNPGYISCERCGVQSTRHNRVCRALKKMEHPLCPSDRPMRRMQTFMEPRRIRLHKLHEFERHYETG